MKAAAAIVCLLALSACATNSVQNICLPLKTWSDADQDQLRKEYDALAPAAKMRLAFQDYVAMRDADRACQNGAH